MPDIYWGMLTERTIHGWAHDSALDIAGIAALKGHIRISMPYMRTDMARNRLCRSFLELAQDPNDVLVMLDCDHVHPQDVVMRLAAHPPECGVVGALYFRRGEPFDPLFFRRDDGRLRNPAEWDEGMVYECDAVATGAIAIRKWVLDQLDEADLGYPYFQYTYPGKADFSMTEDIFFAERCEAIGIRHYCDTSIITPHLGVKLIGLDDWRGYAKAHPEILDQLKEVNA